MLNISNEKKGLHNLLRISFVYNLVQFILGTKRGRDIFINDYIKPIAGDKILDFGCGTGSLFGDLKYLNNFTYFGIDPNDKYINLCRTRYSDFQNAHFSLGSIEILESISEKFDTIVLSAVLHHLSIDSWSEIIKKLYLKLNSGGKIVLLDIVFHPNQNFISKILVSLDRGISVLELEDYLSLIAGNYEIESNLRTNLMRFPYSHIITTIK